MITAMLGENISTCTCTADWLSISVVASIKSQPRIKCRSFILVSVTLRSCNNKPKNATDWLKHIFSQSDTLLGSVCLLVFFFLHIF